MKTRTLLATTAFLALSGIARSTPLGINTDPGGAAWDRGDGGSAYAVMDNFSSFSFSNQTAGFASSGFATISISQSTALTGDPGTDQGAGLYDNLSTFASGADVLYSGGRAPSFSIDATTAFSVNTVTLQIKRPMSTSDSFETELVLTLNGFVPDSMATVTGSGDTTSSAGTYAVTTFTWSSSISEGVTSFDIDFSNSTVHRGYDAIALDAGVTPVPEPGTYAIAAALLALVGFRVYRSRGSRMAGRA